MNNAPFRLLFFLAAIAVLGIFAAAITLPHMFSAGSPIVAEQVNENFTAVSDAIEQLALDVSTLDETVTGLGDFESNYAELSDRIDEVEGDVASLAGSLADTNQAVDALAGAVEGLDEFEANFTALTDRIDDVEGDVTSLESSLRATNQDLDRVASGARALASDVTTLEAAVAEVPGPAEVLSSSGTSVPTAFEKEQRFFVDETITTTTPGRWLVQKSFGATMYCDADHASAIFYIAIDGEPVRSTALSVPEGNHAEAVLSGVTDQVVEAGEHTIAVYGDCVDAGYGGHHSVLGSIATVVVFPE